MAGPDYNDFYQKYLQNQYNSREQGSVEQAPVQEEAVKPTEEQMNLSDENSADSVIEMTANISPEENLDNSVNEMTINQTEKTKIESDQETLENSETQQDESAIIENMVQKSHEAESIETSTQDDLELPVDNQENEVKQEPQWSDTWVSYSPDGDDINKNEQETVDAETASVGSFVVDRSKSYTWPTAVTYPAEDETTQQSDENEVTIEKQATQVESSQPDFNNSEKVEDYEETSFAVQTQENGGLSDDEKMTLNELNDALGKSIFSNLVVRLSFRRDCFRH